MEKLSKKPPLPLIFAVILLCAFLGFSCGPVMKVLMARGMHPTWIVGLRSTMSLLFFWPMLLLNKKNRQDLLQTPAKTKAYSALAGVFIGIYFICWVFALRFTSVFNTVTVICIQFILMAVLSYIFLKEKILKVAWVGIISSFIGIGVIAYSDISSLGNGIGTLIAVGCAIGNAGYFVIGRHVRKTSALIPHVGIANTVCAFMLLTIAIIFGGDFILDALSIALLILITVCGSIVGLIGPNWALKYVTNEVLGITQLASPVLAFIGAAIVAAAFDQPQESLSLLSIIGSIIIISGVSVYMVLKNRENKKN